LKSLNRPLWPGKLCQVRDPAGIADQRWPLWPGKLGQVRDPGIMSSILTHLEKGFSSFSKTPRGFWADTYLQPLDVLQGYFKPENPLKVLATLKNPWKTPKGCKYVPAQQPLGFLKKLDNPIF
jgi:hypothetical protein